MQFAKLLALAIGAHAAALPSIEARQDSASSGDSLQTKVSLGDTHIDWGTDLPSDALIAALNAQCAEASYQCETETYTYSTATSVFKSYSPGGSGVYPAEIDNLVFTMNGNWATDEQRQNLIAAMGAAIGAATADNSFYEVGSPGNAYLAATPGGEVVQYNAPSFVGISIIEGDATDAYMNMNVQEINAEDGWCEDESSTFGAISAAVGAIPVVGGTAASVFGFISSACS